MLHQINDLIEYSAVWTVGNMNTMENEWCMKGVFFINGCWMKDVCCWMEDVWVVDDHERATY